MKKRKTVPKSQGKEEQDETVNWPEYFQNARTMAYTYYKLYSGADHCCLTSSSRRVSFIVAYVVVNLGLLYRCSRQVAMFHVFHRRTVDMGHFSGY